MNPKQTLPVYQKVLAGISVALVVMAVKGYIYEVNIWQNTLHPLYLVISATLLCLLLGGFLVWKLRPRLTPVHKHLPELFALLFLLVVLCPLFVSLLNRSLGTETYQSFEFIAEKPHIFTQVGRAIRGKPVKEGFELTVRDGRQIRTFRYKKQAYFPLTKPGEPIMVPITRGLLGSNIVNLP